MSESFQEQFIQELSSHLLGHQSVFKPELYDMSREPADLAWISDRCVAIVHATKGGKPLQKKREHNNFQMHTWLRKWRQGHILRGPNVALSYDDIDYVIGLSVVGGREAASIIEDGEILHARKKDISKLFACATITDAVFERLCQKSVGLKDIIHFF